MRILNDSIITDGAMSGTDVLTSEAVYLAHIAQWSVQASYVRTAPVLTGAYKIQVSNAALAQALTGTNKPQPAPDAVWTDLASATGSVTDVATGSGIINMADAGYSWGRVVYTNATGTGTLQVRVTGKGV